MRLTRHKLLFNPRIETRSELYAGGGNPAPILTSLGTTPSFSFRTAKTVCCLASYADFPPIGSSGMCLGRDMPLHSSLFSGLRGYRCTPAPSISSYSFVLAPFSLRFQRSSFRPQCSIFHHAENFWNLPSPQVTLNSKS